MYLLTHTPIHVCRVYFSQNASAPAAAANGSSGADFYGDDVLGDAVLDEDEGLEAEDEELLAGGASGRDSDGDGEGEGNAAAD